MPKCELCGEPMPEGEEMFKFHGYSGDCPKPPQAKPTEHDFVQREREIMGTLEQSESELMKKAREWRETRQPIMGTAKELKEREQRDRQIRFELANAALHWLWHKENPAPAA